MPGCADLSINPAHAFAQEEGHLGALVPSELGQLINFREKDINKRSDTLVSSNCPGTPSTSAKAGIAPRKNPSQPSVTLPIRTLHMRRWMPSMRVRVSCSSFRCSFMRFQNWTTLTSRIAFARHHVR